MPPGDSRQPVPNVPPVLPPLDWQQPWYAPWRLPGEALADRIRTGEAPDRVLDGAAPPAAFPVRFVPAQALPPGLAYETFIFRQRQVPTREGLHDFFNGLVWLALPRSKARLNELQAAEIERAGIGSRRGPVRDAITLLDENGALLQAPPPLWEALRARAWRRLFVELRPLWSEARLWVVGHALLEQLATPRKNLTAHVWCLPARLEDAAAADLVLAGQLDAATLAGKPFTPLPVLGLPGWHPGNTNFSFYDDSTVFRPPKAQTNRTTVPPAGNTGT